jgi:Holliday junction resolvase
MPGNYKKGYRGENELVHMLAKKGFMALRAPRSGRINLPSPDVIAVKSGKVYAVECKSRKNGFKVPAEQLEELLQWEKIGGSETYVAWKIAYKGWFFIPLKKVMENNGNVGKGFCAENGKPFDEIFGGEK